MVERIEAHLRATGVSEAGFGRRAANDPRLVADLRRGRRVGEKISARIEAIIAGGGQ
jgi:hypothetical protein